MMRKGGKVVKGMLKIVILVAGAVFSFILLSGNHHLFFAFRHTVFNGRWGPSIDEYGIYYNRTVHTAQPKPWPYKDIKAALTEEELAYHTKYGTAAFVVVHRDSVVFEYFDKDHSEQSLTNSWSTSKSIISLLIGAAIDDGLIPDEEELLSTYFEQYKGSGIRIKHLLTMSSGVGFDEHYSNPFAHSAKSLYGDDLIALNEKYQPVTPPGITFDYQGGNSILLGMILRQVTKTSISEYASRKLWQPMHAEHNALWSLDHKDGMERVFCCFNSTARDFARFGKLMIHHGVWEGDTLISPDYIKRATTAADLHMENGSPNTLYGYQWWILQLPNYRGYYARGIQGQYIVILPEEELVLVRLGDSRPSSRYKGHVTDMLYYIDMARRMIQGQ